MFLTEMMKKFHSNAHIEISPYLNSAISVSVNSSLNKLKIFTLVIPCHMKMKYSNSNFYKSI